MLRLRRGRQTEVPRRGLTGAAEIGVVGAIGGDLAVVETALVAAALAAAALAAAALAAAAGEVEAGLAVEEVRGIAMVLLGRLAKTAVAVEAVTQVAEVAAEAIVQRSSDRQIF